MSPVKTPKPPKVGDFDDGFIVKTVSLRGREYTFRELDVTKYDELVEACTSRNSENEELIDNALLRKMVTVATCISPKLPAGLAGLPLRLSNKLANTAAEVNYGVEPEDKKEGEEPEPDIQEGDPEEEGEA